MKQSFIPTARLDIQYYAMHPPKASLVAVFIDDQLIAYIDLDAFNQTHQRLAEMEAKWHENDPGTGSPPAD